MRILIAEDDARLLKSLVHIFELNHYAVDGVDNGDDALSFACSDEYDGLVIDIMMPGMDGLTVLKSLRAMLRRKDNFTPDILSFGALLLNRSTYELVKLSGKKKRG